ncbi:Crp/Fnr family transcriptional regulator [Thalassospira sp.]|uniref:Crp/Fnr family transcriptional regulator n=1 Tax=Thalassospira sp. TaxID=1912094 RepID=UPI001B2F6227|nr:Crp/Fnr family transcriptional regulator [Thalassospira sp.]MBO6808121.1 Crp/Fnr family transcriptional regulator [Thalassospira sp.]MBO6839506.1 Crp/Fnr family transcriptional regulator [Thalassospira sp.]
MNFSDLIGRLQSDAYLAPHICNTNHAKGSQIIKQGEVCQDVIFLRRGLAQMSYVTFEGKEWIKSFFAENSVMGSRRCQIMGEPSHFAITCLEDCEVTAIPYDKLRSVCSKDPDLMAVFFDFNEQVSLRKEKREYEFLCLSAQDRYRGFLEDYAHIAPRLTQAQIASFIGITPIALSRIRKRINQADNLGVAGAQ